MDPNLDIDLEAVKVDDIVPSMIAMEEIGTLGHEYMPNAEGIGRLGHNHFATIEDSA